MTKHHDDHGPDASVPGSGPSAPKAHWERRYNPGPAGKNTPAGAFEPKRSKDRPSTHNKVNECDH